MQYLHSSQLPIKVMYPPLATDKTWTRNCYSRPQNTKGKIQSSLTQSRVSTSYYGNFLAEVNLSHHLCSLHKGAESIPDAGVRHDAIALRVLKYCSGNQSGVYKRAQLINMAARETWTMVQAKVTPWSCPKTLYDIKEEIDGCVSSL